jgi:hypothetical protein
MSAVPPIASKFYAPQRKTPSANTASMHCSTMMCSADRFLVFGDPSDALRMILEKYGATDLKAVA